MLVGQLQGTARGGHFVPDGPGRGPMGRPAGHVLCMSSLWQDRSAGQLECLAPPGLPSFRGLSNQMSNIGSCL